MNFKAFFLIVFCCLGGVLHVHAASPTHTLKEALHYTMRIFDPHRKKEEKKKLEQEKARKAHVKKVVEPVDPLDMDVEEVSIENDTVIAPLSKTVTMLEYYKRDTLYNGVKIPATQYYRIWNNLRMDPYEISIPDFIKDTVMIGMDGYKAPCSGYVTSNYGMRRRRFHHGIDLKVQIGEPVVSSFDGVVRIAMRGKAYGNYIVVRHTNGLETTYAHLSKILVDINTPVKAGQVLGYGGSTGRSTGPHLHYEIRFLGKALNPNLFVDFETITPVLEEIAVVPGSFNFQLTSKPPVSQKYKTYKVKSGDTLSAISKRVGVSVSKLIEINRLSKRASIRSGQILKY